MLIKIIAFTPLLFLSLAVQAADFTPFTSATEARSFLKTALTDSCLAKVRTEMKTPDQTSIQMCECTAQKLSTDLSDDEIQKLLITTQTNTDKTISLEKFLKENPSIQNKIFQSGAACAQPQIEQVFTSVCKSLPQNQQKQCLCFSQEMAKGLSTDDLASLIKIWTLPPQEAAILMGEMMRQPAIAQLMMQAQAKCLPLPVKVPSSLVPPQ